ncbi:anti-sigma factor [Actinoplanes sp. NPDC049265]|uniref:anti-sigma factor n=1 Tax=Actinoplanes sp. NPDC049265 TaxID=3363902 RepID=UPI003719ADE9
MTDDVLDERAAALEGGPCGQTGPIARVSSLLSHPGLWEEPPDLPGGIAGLIAAASSPATDAPPAVPAAPSAAPSAAAGPSTESTRPGDGRPARGPSGGSTRPGTARRRRRQWVTGAVAAVVLAVAGVGGYFATREQPTATIELAGPSAHGRLQVIERDAGWRLVLNAEGLPPAPAGSYYQGWAVKDGQYVPLGTFHMHKQGRVELWSGVPLRQFRRIEITSQRVGAGQQPGPPVLSGTL